MAGEPQRVVIDGEIELDCSVSERHSARVEVTRHPIEDGAQPSDHARELPDVLTIDGILSNAPLGPRRISRGVRGAGAPGYAQEAFGRLMKLKRDRRLVVVVTAHRAYERMMLTALDVPRDARVGDAIRFSATFEEVRVVTLGRQALERPSTVPTLPRKKAAAKKQQPKPAPDARRSLLKKFTDWGGVTSAGDGVTP